MQYVIIYILLLLCCFTILLCVPYHMVCSVFTVQCTVYTYSTKWQSSMWLDSGWIFSDFFRLSFVSLFYTPVFRFSSLPLSPSFLLSPLSPLLSLSLPLFSSFLLSPSLLLSSSHLLTVPIEMLSLLAGWFSGIPGFPWLDAPYCILMSVFLREAARYTCYTCHNLVNF